MRIVKHDPTEPKTRLDIAAERLESLTHARSQTTDEERRQRLLRLILKAQRQVNDEQRGGRWP